MYLRSNARRDSKAKLDDVKKEQVVKRLYKYEDMPSYAQNRYILNGYRMCKTFKESWKSLTYVHNETGNIYTHIFASLVFLGILVDIWLWDIAIGDKVIFSIFCLCAIKCFVASTLFHLHCNQCEKTHSFFVCLDYSGISFMVMGSSVVVTYYLYYCHGVSQLISLGFLICLSFVGIVGSFVDYFNQHPLIRVYVYSATAISSAIPFLLHLYHNSLTLPFYSGMGLLGFTLMTLFYTFGAIIYALRVPERFAPGLFDLLLHSHQIWHMFAFFAALSTYCLALDVYEWHKNTNECYL